MLKCDFLVQNVVQGDCANLALLVTNIISFHGEPENLNTTIFTLAGRHGFTGSSVYLINHDPTREACSPITITDTVYKNK